LTPGRYKVTAELQGFEQKAVSNVRLSADQKVRVDIPLTVGAVSTVVQVDGAAVELVQTETHELSEVVENRRVQELPVNGRSYLSLTATTPGVILGGSQGLKSNTSNFTLGCTSIYCARCAVVSSSEGLLWAQHFPTSSKRMKRSEERLIVIKVSMSESDYVGVRLY